MAIPFKVQPTIKTIPVGDEESGLLEIEKKYDLTPLEIDFIEAEEKEKGIKSQFEEATEIAETIIAKQTETYNFNDVDDLIDEVLKVDSPGGTAIAIARNLKTKQRPLEVSDVVSKLLANDTTIIMENMADVVQWQEKQEKNAPIRDRILATAILKYRVLRDEPTEWNYESTESALKTGELNYKIIKYLADFANNERSHWEKATDELDQEELKKRLSALKAKEKRK